MSGFVSQKSITGEGSCMLCFVDKKFNSSQMRHSKRTSGEIILRNEASHGGKYFDVVVLPAVVFGDVKGISLCHAIVLLSNDSGSFFNILQLKEVVAIRSEEFSKNTFFLRRYHGRICALCSAEQVINHGSVSDQRKSLGPLTLVPRKAEKKRRQSFFRGSVELCRTVLARERQLQNMLSAGPDEVYLP